MIYNKFIYFSLVVQIYASLPSGFPQCYRNDPGLNKCLLNATNNPKIRAGLSNGIPEIKFPKISPFSIPELSLQEGTNSFSFKADLKNIILRGLETYKFTKFDFDVPKLKFFCTMDVGPLYLDADYDLTGKILLAPLEGNGKFNANISKAHIDITHEVKIITKNNEEHLSVIGTKTKLKINDLKFAFKGLLGGNELIENALQSGLDSSRDELIQEFTPILEKTVSSIVDNIFSKFFDVHSYNVLYPNKN